MLLNDPEAITSEERLQRMLGRRRQFYAVAIGTGVLLGLAGLYSGLNLLVRPNVSALRATIVQAIAFLPLLGCAFWRQRNYRAANVDDCLWVVPKFPQSLITSFRRPLVAIWVIGATSSAAYALSAVVGYKARFGFFWDVNGLSYFDLWVSAARAWLVPFLWFCTLYQWLVMQPRIWLILIGVVAVPAGQYVDASHAFLIGCIGSALLIAGICYYGYSSREKVPLLAATAIITPGVLLHELDQGFKGAFMVCGGLLAFVATLSIIHLQSEFWLQRRPDG